MNYKIITFIAVLAISTSASTAMAQETMRNTNGRASNTPMMQIRTDLRTEIEARKASSTARLAEIRAQAEARKASSTAARVEMQRSLAKRKAEQTARVFAATVKRLEGIITRLESRIEKVKVAGGDTLRPEAFVEEAKNHLSEAKTSIALFASIDFSGDKAQENFEKVRETATIAKGHIKEAQRCLMEALRALGSIRSEIQRSAISTATTTEE